MADVNKVTAAARRTERSRTRLKGSSDKPRLAVRASNKSITAQLIDDSQSKTIATAKSPAKGSMTEKAEALGVSIAEAAKAAKIKKVVFDRGSKQYHGRIKALADAARKAGLEF